MKTIARLSSGVTLALGCTVACVPALADNTTLRADARSSPMAVLDSQVQAVRQASRSAPDDIAFCPPVPAGGIAGVTNNRLYFLSEIGGCPQLACFLNQVANAGGVHANSTLIVDQSCTVKQSLTLPDRFTLAGVGIDGEGKLVFELPDNASAIRFKAAAGAPIRHAVIRDLDIQNTACCGQVGINVSNSNLVFIERVRVQGFGFGVYGQTAYSTVIGQSNVSDNGFNAVLGDDTTAWRLRDSVFRGSGLIGVVMSPGARGHVVAGARIEANPVAGVWVAGDMNVIENNWFEGNGGAQHTALRVFGGKHNRVHGNLFSSQKVADQGSDTQLCMNMTFDPDPDKLNSCNVPLKP